jgi:4-hydroxy-3-polyprenylbenzoate decarboxylase
MPLSPGFYLNPTSMDDLVDFMVARMMDLLGVAHEIQPTWDEHLAAERAARRAESR